MDRLDRRSTGVSAQERTCEQLLESLRVALGEALDFNRTEARNTAAGHYEELKIAICSVATCCDIFRCMDVRCFAKAQGIPGAPSAKRQTHRDSA